MRILVLGGTRFVGRAYVEEALSLGHEVTLFSRGLTAPGLFPDLERLRGDRDADLSALHGRKWEVVFDPACYVPRHARMTAELLADAAEHYSFVSTLSVYADETTTGQDETGRLGTLEDPETEDVTDVTYGPLKVLAEQEVQRRFDDRALILRPGYICGPYDSLDRMPFWLRRLERGGEILAPESPEFPVQLIDARDIARFALALAERREGGVFNLCAPQEPHRFGDLLETAARVVGQDGARFTWAPADFLLEHELGAWEAFPWWAPPEEYAFTRFDASAALAAGLAPRPIEDSFRDCWEWDRTRGGAPLREDRGLPAEREEAFLALLRARGETPIL